MKILAPLLFTAALAAAGQSIPPVLTGTPTPTPAVTPGAPSANAALVVISSLPATISAPGNYALSGDFTVSATPAITITANQVTLNLNGRSIIASGTAAGAGGIGIAVTGQEVVILNGHIDNFGLAGVLLNSTGAGTNLKDVVLDVSFNNDLFGVFNISGTLDLVKDSLFQGGSVGVVDTGGNGNRYQALQFGNQAKSSSVAVGYGVFSSGGGSGILVEDSAVAKPQTAGLFLSNADVYRFVSFLSCPTTAVGGTNAGAN